MAIFRGQYITSAAILLLPTFAMLLVVILETSSEGQALDSPRSYVPVPAPLPACLGPPDGCTLFLYTPNTEPYVSIMKKVANSTGIKEHQVVGVSSVQDAAVRMATEIIEGHSQPDYMGVVFNAHIDGIAYFSNNSTIKYTLWLNNTREGAGSVQLGVQRVLDQAIMQYFVERDGLAKSGVLPTFEANLGSFEYPEPPKQEDNGVRSHKKTVIIGANLGWCTMGAVIGLLALYDVAREKKAMLLGAMRTVGLRESLYWITWWCCYAIVLVPAAFLAVIIGYIADYPVFTDCNFLVHVLNLWCYLQAAVALGLFIGATVMKPIWVNALAFIVMCACVTLSSIYILSSVFVEEQNAGPSQTALYYSDVGNFVGVLYFMMPWVGFGKGFFDIQRSTGTMHAMVRGRVVTVPLSFSWADLTRTPFRGVDSLSTTLLLQLACTAVYLTLAWYFAQIINESQGGTRRFWFIFDPVYWGGEREIVLSEGDTLAQVQKESRRDGNVRVHKLTKSFGDTTAVKEMTLEVRSNSIFVLLGHNGAGKTTLLNCLSGLYAPTFGEAFIFGMNVRTQIKQLESVMGHCSQDNLLWDMLTPYNHLCLQGALKGMDKQSQDSDIREALAAFGLEDVMYDRVSTFSGGMKRRLSMSMAIMGRPAIVFADEPTTGMDPVNRRRVWDSIKELRRRCIVILTTHSMEEADYLGDTIGIMSGGRLRALGTSLFLKNHFGAGYQLRLLTSSSEEAMSVLLKHITSLIPRSEVVGQSAGNITVGLPRSSVKYLVRFFSWVKKANDEAVAKAVAETGNSNKGSNDNEEEEDRSVHLVKEWSFCNSTLEEVFLRLCSQESSVNALGINFEAQEEKKDGAYNENLCRICEEGARPTVSIELSTIWKVKFTADDLLCERCAMGDAFVDEKETDNLKAAMDAKIDFSDLLDARAGNVNMKTQKEKESNVESKNEGGDSITKGAIFRKRPVPVPVKLMSQVRAVSWNNINLIISAKMTLLCKFLVLVLGILLLGLLPNETGAKVCPGGYAPIGDNDMDGCKVEMLVGKYVEKMSATYIHALWQVSSQGSVKEMVPIFAPYAYTAMWFQNSAKSGDELLENMYGFKGGLEGEYGFQAVNIFRNIRRPSSILEENANVFTMIYLPNATSQPPECEGYYGNEKSLWYFGKDAQKTAQHESEVMFPVVGVEVERASFASDINTFRYTLRTRSPVDDELIGFGSVDEQKSCGMYSSSSGYGTRENFMSGLHNSFLRSHYGERYGIAASTAQMPDLYYPTRPISPVVSAGLSMVPLVTMLLFPEGVVRIVRERSDNLLLMMRISGLQTRTYWTAQYLFNFFVLFAWSIVFTLTIYFIGSSLFTGRSPMWFILVSTVWCHSMICHMALLTALVKKKNASSIFSYMFVLVVTSLSSMLNIFLKDPDAWSGILWIPAVSYVRAIGLILESDTFDRSELAIALVYNFCTSTVLLAIGILLNMSYYTPLRSIFLSMCKDGVRSGLDRLQIGKYRANRKHVKFVNENDGKDVVGSGNEDMLTESLRDSDVEIGACVQYNRDGGEYVEDVDVANERMRVIDDLKNALKGGRDRGTDESAVPAIRVGNLRKVYAGVTDGKIAVNGLNLGVEFGEVFGLLGPNGAGKTTALSIMAGLIQSSGGLVHMCGYDVDSELQKVYNVLGVCPQFDCVWDELTVRQHLFFYARIKGCIAAKERGVVQRMAEMVELDGDSMHKPAKDLSGGQRRRLSIAISLIGDPQIWLLDEPSTGLSPEARRVIWRIIQEQKAHGRASIISTHSMEEADTLCSRIGIMAEGRMRCVGTQQRLKTRFGTGFKLTIVGRHNFNETDHVAITKYIQEMESSAVLSSTYSDTMLFSFPSDDPVRILSVFARLEVDSRKEEFGILEYGVGQASLEEVFISTVGKHM